MAGEKNFNIKNGLSIGGVEVINSSGNITAGGIGTAVQEAIADKIGGIIQGSGSTTVTYDDNADTITISSTGKTEEEIQDIIGAAIVTNGSHTGLSVAYDDAGDGAIDITVDYSAIAANLIPDGNETRDLGSSTNRWRDLYLSGNTINLGGTEFSKDSDGNVEVSASGTLKSLKVAEIEIGTGSDVLVLKRDSNGKLQSRSKNTSTKTETAQDIDLTNNDSDDLSEGSSNLYYTDARADARITNALVDEDNMSSNSATKLPSQQSVKAYVDAQTTDETAEGSTNLYFTDARVMTSLATVDTHIVPTADVTYDLGSSSLQWRDIYVGPGSLYVNGQQVVSDNSGTITISADDDQNVSVQTGGSGDIELDATGTGNIQIKAPMQIQASNAISSSDGNAIQFSNSIDVDAIESRSADTNLVLTGNGTGNVTVNDALVVTGNLTVQGTTTTVNSETISLADNIIALNSNFTSGSPTEDTGISVTRGGSAAKTLLWDETNDKWTVGSETFVAATFEGNLTGNVTGNVTGSSGSTTGNAATATALATSRTIGLSGDVTGSGSFDGTGNLTITATIADDSHNHTIANVDGLQTALDTKYQSGSNATLGTITTTNASNAGGYVRNIYQSTSSPAAGDGAVGDLWVLYS
jgi:hypothetical protein